MSRRSSGRIRTLNQRARTSLAKESTENGESTTTFERNTRLEALENDGVHYIDTQEADPEEEVFSKKRGKKKRKTGFNKKRVPSLNYVLEQEFYESYAKNVPTYLTTRSSPSQYPPRHFCSVCGFTAPYTCIRCGLRMCSSRCTTVHWETLRSTHY